MKALVFLRLFAGVSAMRDPVAGTPRRAVRHSARPVGRVRAWRPFGLWRLRMRDERVLQSMSDHVLKDIGFRRDERRFEISGRFRH